MVELRTSYLGLSLRSPLVASAGPLTGHVSSLRDLEDCGIGAVVLPSLFEEEVVGESLQLHDRLSEGTDAFSEAGGFFPEMDFYDVGPERHLWLVEAAKRELSVPVIASVNARSHGAWERYARQMAGAGADAIELNLYGVAADPRTGGQQVERGLLDLIAAVRSAVDVPLAVKLSPFFSSLAAFAVDATLAGADGLVLFNRFYQPDLDLDTLDLVPRIELSTPSELRLPMRWIGILRPLLPRTSLAATSGVHSGEDAAKALLVGADVVMMTSALLHHGARHVERVEAELIRWLADRDYVSVAQMRGSVSRRTAPNPAAYERAQYVRTLASYEPVERLS